ncbi:MAG: cytochrome c biogenesis protein ResB, partial [Bacteroidetes bacterium]|nr:cytochrome c biogenesis protein ResB [Bacteroidota bacterium]
MKKVLSILFSMELMGLMVMAFAVAIGVATFVENDFGTVGAKAVVYNATWFEILLVLLAINLVANIFKYKMYRKQKLVVFTFHLSFIIILIGAGITRFIGFEGIMSIREGQTESTMLSDNTYVMTELIDGEQKVYTDEAVLMSALSEKSYSDKASINGKSFRFKSVRYVPNAQEMLVKGQAGEGAPYVIMVVSTANSGRNNLIIKKGDQRRFLGQNFLFDQKDTPGAIQLSYENGELKIKTPEVLTAMSMAGGDSDTLAANQWQAFEMRKLYSMGDMRIVLTDIYENGKVDFSAYRGNDMNFMDAMIVEVESGGQTKEIALRGGKGYLGETAKFELNGTTVN